ncbi:hypothetical protein CR492_04845 [Methylocella silvestris]|uniref:Lipoprotein n=1 Tax=Methylocella silvestris TaxID=199596 RepID=A0A2J7TJU1_METSI|nr:hypothetical protein CR492_04845 [Methylocella silvestris]
MHRFLPALCAALMSCASFARPDLGQLQPDDQRTCLAWEANAREAHRETILRNCIRKFQHIYEVRR